MEQKNKKIILILIIVLAILAFIFATIFAINKNKAKNSSKTTPAVEKNLNDDEEDQTPKISEEKKAQVAAIRNIKGKITAIDISAISVTPTTGEKLTLKVPQKGANFSSLTKQKDGSFMAKEIGLFEIPKNKEVDIQYNSTTNEVTLVTVK
ncbi:MAG: hypothetical protein Q7U36_03660 [bacterium]|nr:hypothetical protein [bacterium]